VFGESASITGLPFVFASSAEVAPAAPWAGALMTEMTAITAMERAKNRGRLLLSSGILPVFAIAMAGAGSSWSFCKEYLTR
jgi:hypothetical protein